LNPVGSEVDPNFCWYLSRAGQMFTAKVAAALEDLGVSPRGHHVLFKATRGEFTQTELARMTGLDKTTMVVTLDELEALGLAERRPASHDRRAHAIFVTKAGERLVRDGQRIAARVTEEVLGALAEPEREVFVDSLRELLEGPLSEPEVAKRGRHRVASAAPSG
jgi:MarR family transcriptional regulator, transcriptional regulator for hemolysin